MMACSCRCSQLYTGGYLVFLYGFLYVVCLGERAVLPAQCHDFRVGNILFRDYGCQFDAEQRGLNRIQIDLRFIIAK